ncbi:MAG: DUF3570 domain-containing protein [Nevskiaceae bacterium]|nr:MAG: DUF3570 domain-containing protein [Nevskiaceae bacterium]TAM28199.1 MAG: DUF3570 domain-containing protein [Nevskiaceae bacterium]
MGEHWSLEGSAVVDSVSGASPRYYSTVSGASHMDDLRTAGDAKLTYYRERSAYSVSLSRSQEHDYISNAAALDARFSSDDNNTTVNLGVGAARDSINPTNDLVDDETKNSVQGIVGVTRALTAFDLVQLQLAYSSGRGYFSDPYKLFDNRPRERKQSTALLRWNHHVVAADATLRLSYRYYNDSYGIAAHTLGMEWVQPLGRHFSLTPALRYYTQSSADFYIDPPASGPFPNIPEGAYSSLDQRLSAFGALAVAGKLEWRISPEWSTDFKAEYYQQRSEWRLTGDGSPGLEPFRYVSLEFGLTRRF